MQIEKQIENKIVKGWNQMINDLTPKIHNAALSIADTANETRCSTDDPVAFDNDKGIICSKQDRAQNMPLDSSQHSFLIEPRCKLLEVS